MPDEASIVTIKWGSEFTSEDVNILKRAALEHCRRPVRFICLTDNPTGLDTDIEAHAIPTSGLECFPRSSGGWGKLCLFHPEVSEFFEDALFLDIDTVVIGPLDPFFELDAAAMRMLSAGKRWRAMDERISPMPATGVFRYRSSENIHIFRAFAADPDGAYSAFNLEQDFVGHYAKAKTYFPVGWIESFKYHLRRDPVLDLFLPPRAPGSDAKLVAFHGFPRPRSVATPGLSWSRFPRCGIHRPKWLIEYWDRYSQ